MEKVLLTPGPINTTFKVKSQALVDYGSRDTLFIDKLQQIHQKVYKIFKINPQSKLTLLQGSGTYGVESVITSVQEKILVLINGAYGQRMKKILEYRGKPFEFLTFEEGTEIDYGLVEEYLAKQNDIGCLALVHLETTTGVLNDLDKIKQIAKKHNKKLIVDCIASFASDVFDFNDLDFVIASCNKCLQGLPGFCLVISKSFDSYASPSYVLDLNDQNKYFQSSGQFRFTPPTHVLAAFHSALEELELETLEARASRFRQMKKLVYEMCAGLNIAPLVDEGKVKTGNICHTFLAPNDENYNFKVLYDSLASFDFLIYPGKLTKLNSFRIGTIGCIGESEMKNFLSYFRLIYSNMLSKKATKIEEIDTT